MTMADPSRGVVSPSPPRLGLFLAIVLIALSVLDRFPVVLPLGLSFPLSAYRLASLPLFAAMLLWLLYRRTFPWAGAYPTALFLWAWLAATAASALGARFPDWSLLHLMRFVEYAAFSQVLAAVFFVSWRPDRWRWLASGVAVSAVVVSLTIITDFFGLSGFYRVYESQQPYVRHVGLLGEANYAGAKLAIFLPFLLQLGLTAFREGRSGRGYAAMVSIFVVLFALFITGSRMGGLLAFLLFAMYLFQEFRWMLRPKVLLSGAVAALIVLGVAWALDERVLSQAFRYIGQRYALLGTFLTTGQETFREVTETSLQERLTVLRGGLKMFVDHPLLGVGLAHFPLRLGEYEPEYSGYYSHNTYLTALSEGGLLGGLLFFALLARVFVLIRRASVRFPEYKALLNSYVLVLLAFLFLHDLENPYLWALFLPFALHLERRATTPGRLPQL